MRISLVGHGPSLLQNNNGKDIDAADIVVRLKRSKQGLLDNPAAFGKRCDIACGSLIIGADLLKHWWVDKPWLEGESPVLWFLDDSRTAGKPLPRWFEVIKTDFPDKIICDRELCAGLVNTYRGYRQPYAPAESQERKVRQGQALSDDCGHLHPSAGLFAIAYALALQPDSIELFGFDNLLSGTHTWSVTRGPDWTEYPDHNWLAESKTLARLIVDAGKVLRHDEPGRATIEN